VRPYAHIPPAVISDLVVLPTTVEGQLQLRWTAPTVLPGSGLEAYQIRVQTFSVADVGGSTTTWWDTGGGVFVQGLYGESPGATVTRTLGPPGSSHTASLWPGATVYAAVRSADDLGIQFDDWSSIVAASRGSPRDAPPDTPTGLSVTVGTNSVVLDWTPLTPTQGGIDFDRYRIYRSLRSGDLFSLIASTTSTQYIDSAIVPGVRYYYRITAIDQGMPAAPGGITESLPSTEVSARLGDAVGTGKPAKPNGLLVQQSNGTFTFSWHAVTQDTGQSAISIYRYRVDRYDQLNGTVTLSTPLMPEVQTYGEVTGTGTYFYRVVAIAIDGTESEPSDFVDSTRDANRYAIAPDDPATMVIIPSSLQNELRREHNSYGEDIELALERRPADEVDITLRSYRILARLVVSREEVPRFAFSRSEIQVNLGYGASIQGISTNGLGSAPAFTPPPTPLSLSPLAHMARAADQSLTRIVSVYWFNGGNYLPVGSPILTTDNALSVSVRNLGVYQIRVVRVAEGFRLTRGSPYPRLITPHDPAQNNRVFFFYDNPTDEIVTGTIYDIRGAKVRELAVNELSPTSNSLVWDGRDSQGSIAPTGIYLYQIRAGKQSATGTVVVAE